MSESAIRTQIATIVSDIQDIGIVHDYERWAVDWGKFIVLFKDPASGKILGWEVGRKPPIGDSKDDQGTIATHTYFVRGYMAVNDAAKTEKTFNSLIEEIRGEFRTKKDLNGAALGTEYIKVDSLDTRSFAGVLCHFTELTLTVYELNA